MPEHLDIARLDAIGVARLKAELVDAVLEVSEEVSNGRTQETVLMHLLTEFGELAQEVIIAQGRSYKGPGRDGVVGEAVDLVLCVVDLAYVAAGDDAESVRRAMALSPGSAAVTGTPDEMILSLLAPLAAAGRRNGGMEEIAPEPLIVDTALALIASAYETVTHEDVLDIARSKLEKWRKTANIRKV